MQRYITTCALCIVVTALFLCNPASGNDVLARVPNTWVEPSMGSLADLVRFSDQRESVNAIVRDYNIVQFARLAKTQNLFRRITADTAGKTTLFAPTDAAFQALPPFVLAYLQKNPPILEKVLTNHVVSGEYFFADLAPDQPLTSLAGSPLRFAFVDANVEVNGANIIKPHDILGVDGVMHLVDKVIVPEDVQIPPCASRCLEVIGGNSDMRQLDAPSQQKFCGLQCAAVTPSSITQKKPFGRKNIDEGATNRGGGGERGGGGGGGKVFERRQSGDQTGFFQSIFGTSGDANIPVLPVARPLLARALTSQYGSREGGRLLDACTSDCIQQGTRTSLLETFSQRQLLEGSCLDNCANLLQKTVARPSDRRSLCMTACTAQNIDGDRCGLLCGRAETSAEDTSMRANCESMCADAPDYANCVGQCANTRGERSVMAGRPRHLISDRQRAFFEARAAQYRK